MSSLNVLYLGYVHYIALIPSSIITFLPRKPFVSLKAFLDFYQNGRRKQLATEVSITTQGSKGKQDQGAHTQPESLPTVTSDITQTTEHLRHVTHPKQQLRFVSSHIASSALY